MVASAPRCIHKRFKVRGIPDAHGNVRVGCSGSAFGTRHPRPSFLALFPLVIAAVFFLGSTSAQSAVQQSNSGEAFGYRGRFGDFVPLENPNESSIGSKGAKKADKESLTKEKKVRNHNIDKSVGTNVAGEDSDSPNFRNNLPDITFSRSVERRNDGPERIASLNREFTQSMVNYVRTLDEIGYVIQTQENGEMEFIQPPTEGGVSLPSSTSLLPSNGATLNLKDLLSDTEKMFFRVQTRGFVSAKLIKRLITFTKNSD